MKNAKAFTLIEAAVVITVIALLVTILLPALITAADKEKSFRAVCANRLKNFGLANSIYANEYDGAFCPMYYLDPNSTGSITTGNPPQHYDERYWLDNRAFRDILKYDQYPKNKRNAPVPPTSGYNSPFNMPADFLCPADKISIDWNNRWNNRILLSYAYNVTDWLVPQGWDALFQYYFYMGHNAGNMPAPSTKLAFIDAIDWWTNWDRRGADYYNWDRVGQASIAAYRSGLSVYAYGPVLYRHNEGANITFYDGHVQYMRKRQIFVYEDYYLNGDRNIELGYLSKKPGMWVADIDMYRLNQQRGGKAP